MGLDMYLTRVSKDKMGHYKREYFKRQVGYWQDTWYIHHWLVKNVQGGKIECLEYEVSKEQLEELLRVCKKVLKSCELTEDGKVKDSTTAQELLPNIDSWYISKYLYDKNYVENVQYTVEIIEKVLKETNFEKQAIFYYGWC